MEFGFEMSAMVAYGNEDFVLRSAKTDLVWESKVEGWSHLNVGWAALMKRVDTREEAMGLSRNRVELVTQIV